MFGTVLDVMVWYANISNTNRHMVKWRHTWNENSRFAELRYKEYLEVRRLSLLISQAVGAIIVCASLAFNDSWISVGILHTTQIEILFCISHTAIVLHNWWRKRKWFSTANLLMRVYAIASFLYTVKIQTYIHACINIFVPLWLYSEAISMEILMLQFK